MKIKLKSKDALTVLATTKNIVNSAVFVSISPEKIDELCKMIKKRIEAGLPERDEEFLSLGNYQEDVQIVFLENVLNFCYWAEKGKEKWKVIFNGVEDDGASALRLVFEGALEENIPILDADFLEKLTLEETKKIFRPSNGIEIPLIEKRHENLVETGRSLNKYFQGQFAQLIKQSDLDAVKITENTIKYFKSFDDSYDGVNFFKRAQLNTFDVAQVPSDKKITNTEEMTAMADYKLPQLLRFLEALKYSNDLAERIDNYELIEAGSQEELEIRSATVWAIELISQKLGISAGLADLTIWWLSRELEINQPYHRTYTIYY